MNAELNELANELAYETIKDSELWDTLESNSAVDAKAAELAKEILELISVAEGREA